MRHKKTLKTDLFGQRRTLSDAVVTFGDFGAMIHVSSLTYLLTYLLSQFLKVTVTFDLTISKLHAHYITSGRERERERERERQRMPERVVILHRCYKITILSRDSLGVVYVYASAVNSIRSQSFSGHKPGYRTDSHSVVESFCCHKRDM